MILNKDKKPELPIEVILQKLSQENLSKEERRKLKLELIKRQLKKKPLN